MSGSGTDGKEHRSTRAATWIVAGLVVVPLAASMIGLGLHTAASDARRLGCLDQGGAVQVHHGEIRQGGPHLYRVEGDRWSLITQGCRGKYRGQCLSDNPGVQALEQNLGQPVQVQTCDGQVVGYTVAGRRYRHAQPVARSD
jgi:hypothetical protein